MAELARPSALLPSETRDRVELSATFSSGGDVTALWAAIEGCEGLQARLVDHFGTDIEPGDVPSPEVLAHNFRLVLSKERQDGRERFLTVEGFANYLMATRAARLPPLLEVAVDFEPFSTLTTSVAPWGTGIPVAAAASIQGDTPRRFSRDLAGDLVPASAATWILAGALPSGRVAEALALAAASILPFALTTETWRQDGEVVVALKGERNIKAVAPEVQAVSREDHEALNAVAGWVYGHPDAEVRHVLFVNEAARIWRDEEAWTGAPAIRLKAALTQAGVAYGHHLRDKAKDAMKSLVDLRKAVGDEVDKAAGQARELIGTLWRDFAVAVGALAIRFLSQSSTVPGLASGAILVGTAVFLAYSFAFSVWLNKRFNGHTRRAA